MSVQPNNPDSQSGAAYTWNAADYDNNSSMQYGLAQELLPRLDLRGDEQILDIGCGSGRITADLAGRVPDGGVVGVDLSPAMIRFAQEQYPPAQFPNLRFQIMDAQDLRFQGEFDRVVSFAALHWVPDHPAILRGIYASLKPGGRILLQFGGQGNVAAVLAIAAQVCARAAWRDYFHDFPSPWIWHGPAEYRHLLEQAGLRVSRLDLVRKDLTRAGKDGFAGWFRTAWVPYVQRIPEDRQAAFIDEVTDAYVAHYPPDGAGHVHIEMMRLEVEASKE